MITINKLYFGDEDDFGDGNGDDDDDDDDDSTSSINLSIFLILMLLSACPETSKFSQETIAETVSFSELFPFNS